MCFSYIAGLLNVWEFRVFRSFGGFLRVFWGLKPSVNTKCWKKPKCKCKHQSYILYLLIRSARLAVGVN